MISMVVAYSSLLSKSSILAVRRTDLERHCEIIWIQIETRGDPILFGAFSCPPNSDATTLEEMNAAILLQTDLMRAFDWSCKSQTLQSVRQCVYLINIHLLQQTTESITIIYQPGCIYRFPPQVVRPHQARHQKIHL